MNFYNTLSAAVEPFEPSGRAITLYVCGITPYDTTPLGHAFYTTKSAGLGMELAIARSIVQAHGGLLEAENNPDGGATFSFSLPVSQDGP